MCYDGSMKKVMFVLFTMVALGGAALLSNVVSADNDSVVDEINITVPVSCTLSGTGMNTHNATINNGQYNSAIGETTLQAFCNDTNGFAIYAIGYTDDTDGKNVLTNSTLGNTYDIETGTAITGNDSQWAMKLSTIASLTPTYPIIIAGSTDDTEKEQGDPDFTTFQEIPDDYTLVAKRTAGTDIGANAEGATLKTTYQAYISKTQPAGTYTGQVKYTMVHPYNAAEPIACKPSGTTISTIVCMQDISASNKTTILASMTEEQEYELIDKRDNKLYLVSKLKDGNIWMMQNLDLDLDSNTTYTNKDTDLGWNGVGYNTASWSPLRSTYNGTTKTWCQGGMWNTQYDYCEYNYTPESYDVGDLYWNGTLTWWGDWMSYNSSCTRDAITHEQACDETRNPIDTYTTILDAPIREYHLGNYYNWAAAVAMNDTSSYTTEGQNANQSICPAGWTLPKGGPNNTSSGSFRYLIEQYGWRSSDDSTISTSYLFDKIPFSNIWDGHLSYIGAQGLYPSSTIGSYTSYAAATYCDPESSITCNMQPDAYSRTNGISVRCIAR